MGATEDAGAEEEKETDMFRVRKRGNTADAASGKRTDVDEGAVIASRLEDYFGKDEDLDENERFLKDYLHSEGWRDKDRVRTRSPPQHTSLPTSEAGNEVWAEWCSHLGAACRIGFQVMGRWWAIWRRTRKLWRRRSGLRRIIISGSKREWAAKWRDMQGATRCHGCLLPVELCLTSAKVVGGWWQNCGGVGPEEIGGPQGRAESER